jgi:hypothetical protein
MIIGKNKVTEWVRYNKTPYWRIKRSESEQHNVFNSGDEENIPMEESINRLTLVFNILSPGNYFIEAWTTKGQTKNWNRDHFQILPDNNDYLGSAQLQQMSQQNQPSVDVSAEVQKGIDKYKTEVELQELRRKVADLEQENKELSSGLTATGAKIYNRFEPYLGMILNSGNQTSAALGSISDDEAQKLLDKIFEEWYVFEKDPIPLIEKIVSIGKKDVNQYNMYKTLLMQQ